MGRWRRWNEWPKRNPKNRAVVMAVTFAVVWFIIMFTIEHERPWVAAAVAILAGLFTWCIGLFVFSRTEQ